MALPFSSKQRIVTDLDLVFRFRQGDPEAFSELVRRYYERLYNSVYALVGGRDDADDLTQEVFLKAYRSLGKFRGKSQFYTWLYRIGVNCCLDWLKSPNRRINDLSLERERWEGREDRGRIQFRSTDEGVEQRELQAILESALEALPDDYRVVVVMREFDGLTYEEIAHFMHCNIGTVKSRLFRARTRLREIMKIDYKAWFGA